MKAALSSPSCFFSCLGRGPGGGAGEGGGSPVAVQASGPQEVDAAVLPLAPTSLDASAQERRTLTRLYSHNGGYHLRILPDGTVSGGRQENDPYDVLRIKAVNIGVVVIKGEAAGRYLAMDGKGHLYGSQTLNDECYFLEKYEENHYNTYRSQRYSWYVGLKRSGRPKAGPNTGFGQKSIFFLPRPVSNL